MSFKEEVVDVIAKTLSVDTDEVVQDARLFDSIGVDSTEMVELTLALDKQFGIKIQVNEITKFSTPTQIVSLLENRKNP